MNTEVNLIPRLYLQVLFVLGPESVPVFHALSRLSPSWEQGYSFLSSKVKTRICTVNWDTAKSISYQTQNQSYKWIS